MTMEIFKHPLCTDTIGAPSDMQDGSCEALPVAYHEDLYGKWTLSFWKPNAEELAALNEGGTIVLHVRAVGRQHPVVGIGACPKVDEQTVQYYYDDLTGDDCSVCGEPQFMTPHGRTCPNGHGGAEPK